MTAIPAVPSEPPLTDEAALSDAELAEIEARAAAATPGPWGVGNDEHIVRGLEITGSSSYTCISAVATVAPEDERESWLVDDEEDELAGYVYVEPEADAEFIAAARTDVPRLVASLRSAREEITALRGWINNTDAVLEAALGDRWSPDRPPADGVQQLAEERDQRIAESERLGNFANAKVQLIDAARAARFRIAEAHSKHVDQHGGTTGDCNECNWKWPCPTYVWATTDRDPNGPWDPADDEESADV